MLIPYLHPAILSTVRMFLKAYDSTVTNSYELISHAQPVLHLSAQLHYKAL